MGPKPTVPVKVTGLFDVEDDMFAETDAPEKTITIPLVRNAHLPNIQKIAAQSVAAQPEKSTGEIPWLQTGLIVKCLNNTLSDGKYFQRSGVVQRVVADGWGAHIQMVDSHDVLLLDQDDCGSTLPAVNDSIRIVKGVYLNRRALYIEPSPDGCDAIVELSDERGRIVSVPKSHVCAFKNR
jgi:hypothetical protein